VENAFPSLSFESPLYFTQAPGDDNRAFVVGKNGIIRVFANSTATTTTRVFLDIRNRIDDDGEQGLLGLAFDPAYASNGRFYVHYNPSGATRQTRISRFTVSNDPDVADAASEDIVLQFEQPAGFSNHKGGWIGFGPDGKLYIATGDGGGNGDPNNNAQNLDSPLGKILRINADGSIPTDNPFAGQSNRRGDIWAYGLRNPFRASFDRATGAFWVADAGQNQWEEINLVTKGGNYGWRKYEGTHIYNTTDPVPGNATLPLHEYDHSSSRCSIIGGYAYRGTALRAFDGAYLYGDFCTGDLWALTRAGGDVTNARLPRVPGQLTSFGEDNVGEIYISSFDGRIYKLVPAN
jgi:glucose/arabinose dehydrogenase